MILGFGYRCAMGQDIRYEDYELQASDRKHSDQFGCYVAVYGDIAVVGDYLDNQLGQLAGAAHVFRYTTENNWTEEAKLLAPNGSDNDNFGYSVAAGHNIVIVGAPGYNPGGTVFVYRYIQGIGWDLEAELKGHSSGFIGSAIAISGDTIITGDESNSDKEHRAGAVYLFRFQIGLGWIEEAVLYPSEPYKYSYFGKSVSIDSNTIAIGADLSWSGYERQGSVYVFRCQSDGTWIEEAKLQASDGQVSDRFGWSVSLSGKRLLVGAPYFLNDPPSHGYAYIFEYTSSNDWFEKEKLVPAYWSEGDDFSNAVYLNGDIALIGSVSDEHECIRSGSAYIFKYMAKDDKWIEHNKLLASDRQSNDWFGMAVGLDKGIAVIGAYYHTDIGAAFVYHNIAPLSLQIKGSCPGQMQVTVYGGETKIGDRLVVVYGTKKGSSEVVPYCAGLFVDIGQPVKIAGYGKADGMGEFSVVGKVPQRGCGKILVQGVNITKCEKTQRALVF